MNRRAALSLAGMAAAYRMFPKLATAQDHSLAASIGNLPNGVAFHQFSGPATSSEIKIFSSLISVSRRTWGANGNLGGFCYEAVTGGPEIILVEDGALHVAMFPTSDQAGDFPRLIRKDDSGQLQTPVSVLPNTQIELKPGELIAFPNGASCSLLGPSTTGESVTFLNIYGLTSYADSQGVNYPDTQMIEQPLDLALGIATANPQTPPTIVLGRLSFAPKVGLPLSSLAVPAIFSVRIGSATFTTNMEGAVIRRSGSDASSASEPLPANKEASMATGDSSYVLPGTTGSLANQGAKDMELWVALIIPPSAVPGTPAASIISAPVPG